MLVLEGLDELMCLTIATAPTRLGSDGICSVDFFFVATVLLAMFAYAVACRDKTLPEHRIISFFPPVLALIDAIGGAKWSLLYLRPVRYSGSFSWFLYGVDQTMISILCVSFELLFAMEALRGPRRWQRCCGALFAIHSVAVIVYMTMEIKDWP